MTFWYERMSSLMIYCHLNKVLTNKVLKIRAFHLTFSWEHETDKNNIIHIVSGMTYPALEWKSHEISIAYKDIFIGIGYLLVINLNFKIFMNYYNKSASWASDQSSWLFITRFRIRFLVLPWIFFFSKEIFLRVTYRCNLGLRWQSVFIYHYLHRWNNVIAPHGHCSIRSRLHFSYYRELLL